MANQKIKKSATLMGVVGTIIIVIAFFTIMFTWLATNSTQSGVTIDSRYNESYNKTVELIEKYPYRDIVAYLDYKTPRDNITFVEAILYNEWAKQRPVYIVESDDPENGPFTVKRYLSGNPKPEPPEIEWGKSIVLKDSKEFENWEGTLRKKHRVYHREISQRDIEEYKRANSSYINLSSLRK